MKILIIGLGTFGLSLLEELKRDGTSEIVILDKDENLVELNKEGTSFAVIGNSMNMETIQRLPTDIDVAICCIGSDMASSLITCINLKEFQMNRIIARSSSAYHSQILKAIGIDKDDIIFPEEEVGIRLGKRLLHRHVFNNIILAGNHVLSEIKIKNQFVGMKLKDLHLRERFKINVVAIKYREKEISDDGENIYVEKILDVPDPDYIFTPDTTLVVVGEESAIERFKEEI
ncbi:MAG: potassium channel family protein [Exilispira sp.]